MEQVQEFNESVEIPYEREWSKDMETLDAELNAFTDGVRIGNEERNKEVNDAFWKGVIIAAVPGVAAILTLAGLWFKERHDSKTLMKVIDRVNKMAAAQLNGDQILNYGKEKINLMEDVMKKPEDVQNTMIKIIHNTKGVSKRKKDKWVEQLQQLMDLSAQWADRYAERNEEDAKKETEQMREDEKKQN